MSATTLTTIGPTVGPTRLGDGRSVVIRPATSQDAGDLVAMHARCSPESVRRRYLSFPTMTGRFLSQLLTTDVALVAQAANRTIVALGNLGRETDDTAELAVIVDDGWQRAGLGTELVRHLVNAAWSKGYREIYAVSVPENLQLRRTLGRFGPLRRDHTDDGTVRLWLRPACGDHHMPA